MSLRRIVALLVLALDTYVLLHVAPALGMLGPVVQMICALVGIGALGVLVFNLPLARRHRTEGNKGPSGEGDNGNSLAVRAAGLVGVLVLVVAPLFIAARGLYLGVLPSFVRPRGPDVSFSQAPGLFTLNLLVYIGWGSTFLFLVLRNRRATEKSQKNIRRTSTGRKV